MPGSSSCIPGVLRQPFSSTPFEVRERTMNKFLRVASITVALCIGLFAGRANASVLFLFTETGGTVTMTSSGTLDTSKLVLVGLSDGWGGTGTEDNPGQIDIMGGTLFGPVNTEFGFHAGT